MYLSVSRYLTNVETSYFFTYPFRSVIKTRGSRTRNRATAMWVAKMEARAPACYGSSLGSNPDIPEKCIMGDISKVVANTL